MKKCFYLSISAFALLTMVGCSDDKLTNSTGSLPQGNGIVFGASAGYAGDTRNTRTIYGDKNAEGTSQAIEWVVGDDVSMYSPTSPVPQADYEVNNISTDNHSSAYLVAPQNGLQWSSSGDTQDFYAIYPAPSSMSNEAIRNIVSFENGKLTGYIPVNQAHTISHSGNTWTAQPVMDYLYMAAVEKDVQIPTAENGQGGVSLDFVPLTTTLEITIHGTATSANTQIVQLNVFADNGENIAGYFTCDLANGRTDSEGYPQCEYQESSTVRDMITVSTYYNNGTTNVPMTLTEGESVTFNVFLLPHEDLSNLRLRIVGLNTTGKQMTLTPITLHPHKKTCIEVNVPTFGDTDTNNWMSTIDDNVFVSQLSIPGTANSFSYNYGWGNSSRLYQTQTADFETQWNSGIRCFELKCPNNESGNSLDNVTLQCNGANLGITFGEAVDMIWGKVENTGEFAMIIPFFENQGGREGNVTDFANDLNQFFTDHNYNYVTYGRNITLGEARGSLMFIARITSEEDDDNIRNAMPAPTQGVFIENWGSLKDNWARRGYTINGNVVDNWATSLNLNTMEHYLFYESGVLGEGSDWTPDTYPSRVESNVNFMHKTVRQGGSTGSAYIQDWSRVVADDEARTVRLSGTGLTNRGEFFYWPASYTEKKNDVYDTFIKAIEDNNNQQGSTFYINSLDGYFIDWHTENSYQPFIEGRYSGGGCGDIPTFAEQINNDFYNDILNYGENNIYGSMNIVLMDMVYEGNGGTYLPSVIINNNFRFPLLTSGSTSTTNYNASYDNGGNAISGN